MYNTIEGNKYRKGCSPWNKGIKWEEQSGENNSFYGKKHTKETRQKMSISAKNRDPNRKGQKCSEETKKKMSIAKKKYWKMKKQEIYAVSF